jgi:FolB domain-containing protein
MNDMIEINDLEVHFKVGVPDEERAVAQKLLITIRLYLDFEQAASTDDLNHTIDYYRLTRDLVEWGSHREWKLIETLASHIADWVLRDFQPAKVDIQIKKFILPDTQFVGVSIERSRQ